MHHENAQTIENTDEPKERVTHHLETSVITGNTRGNTLTYGVVPDRQKKHEMPSGNTSKINTARGRARRD